MHTLRGVEIYNEKPIFYVFDRAMDSLERAGSTASRGVSVPGPQIAPKIRRATGENETGLSVLQCDGGLIVERYEYFDFLALYKQIGVL